MNKSDKIPEQSEMTCLRGLPPQFTIPWRDIPPELKIEFQDLLIAEDQPIKVSTLLILQAGLDLLSRLRTKKASKEKPSTKIKLDLGDDEFELIGRTIKDENRIGLHIGLKILNPRTTLPLFIDYRAEGFSSWASRLKPNFVAVREVNLPLVESPEAKILSLSLARPSFQGKGYSMGLALLSNKLIKYILEQHPGVFTHRVLPAEIGEVSEAHQSGTIIKREREYWAAAVAKVLGYSYDEESESWIKIFGTK